MKLGLASSDAWREGRLACSSRLFAVKIGFKSLATLLQSDDDEEENVDD